MDIETKNVYVVYKVDLDNDCLKKSEIEILAVYTDECKAKLLQDSYKDWVGYSEDPRCYYVTYKSLQLN